MCASFDLLEVLYPLLQQQSHFHIQNIYTALQVPPPHPPPFTDSGLTFR